jgi:hypothetical protein
MLKVLVGGMVIVHKDSVSEMSKEFPVKKSSHLHNDIERRAS